MGVKNGHFTSGSPGCSSARPEWPQNLSRDAWSF
jgi:hypothetical protein